MPQANQASIIAMSELDGYGLEVGIEPLSMSCWQRVWFDWTPLWLPSELWQAVQ